VPIYEYKCCGCDEEFEALVLSPSEKVRCPKCDSAEVERRLSCFSVSGGNEIAASTGCAPSGGFS
jgi:putative FmdB family regulatory protein